MKTKVKTASRRIRTSMNFHLQTDVVGEIEHPFGPSMTVPGQVLSLEDLIKKSLNGGLITGRTPQYSDDPDLPEFYKMDEIQLIEYRLELAQKMEGMRQELHDASKALEQKQIDERKKVDEEYEKRKKFVTETPLPTDQKGADSAAKP